MASDNLARPRLLTWLCVFLWIGSAASAIMLPRWQGMASYPSWFSGYIVAYCIATVIAIFGVWGMKKWGLWSYVAVSVVSQLVLISIGHWTVGSVLVICIVLSVIARYRHSFT